MRKKQKIFFPLLLLAVLAIGFLYWFYFAQPGPFLEDKQLIQEMNELNNRAKVSTIQDKIFADEAHVFVPFITEGHFYGAGYWVWRHHKWQIASVDVKESPRIWRVNEQNPSNQYMVWYFDPDDQVNKINFYLLRDRNFHISMGKATYTPNIQMKTSVTLKNKPYGIMKIPSDWSTIITSTQNKNTAGQNFLFSFSTPPSIHIGWMPLDEDGKETFPRKSLNGSSYSTGIGLFDYMPIMNKIDLE